MPGSSLSMRLPTLGVWLSSGLREPGTAGRGEAQEGFVQLEVAVPSWLGKNGAIDQEDEMSQVIIGMDPHKRSAAIEVMAGDETVIGGGQFATGAPGYRAMLAAVRRWPERTWAIEGCQGTGRHIASRLLADGENVAAVPPRLSARTRVFATGQGRKTDATDAHSLPGPAIPDPAPARPPHSPGRSRRPSAAPDHSRRQAVSA